MHHISKLVPLHSTIDIFREKKSFIFLPNALIVFKVIITLLRKKVLISEAFVFQS